MESQSEMRESRSFANHGEAHVEMIKNSGGTAG